jgi:PAS domain S-box-containing protein
VFHYQPRDPAARTAPWPTEAEFRTSRLLLEQPIPIGGKIWQALYRPRAGWIEENTSSLPRWLLTVGLLGGGALAGWVFQLTRRTALVEQIVSERTQEVIESRRELAGFLSALPGMAYRGRYDDQFTLFYVSEGSLALTGYPAEDFLAGRIHLRDLIHPEDLPRVRAITRAAVTAGRELELEYRLRTRDGRNRWVLSRGRGRRAEEVALNYFEGLAIDITAQKLAEQERLGLERKLLEGQKLESLGLLAGGVAHDFNNLLTGILGNANLARFHLPAGSSLHAHLHAIETASLRAAELCRQMLAYAGKGRFVIETINLNTLAEGLVPLLKISVSNRAELRLVLAPALPAVRADATQLRQIVMNLVLNAADAISGRPGLITLATGVVSADHALLAKCAAGADCVPGDYVFLEVRDNGSGMTPAVRAKIFDPFFTTKFAGRGLGLAAALGIVRGHQGALQVDSTPGEGSSFRLLLPPVAEPTALPAAPCAPTPIDWHHTGVALLIGDEEPVRHVGAGMLASFGFTPRVAATGEAGLAIFQENPAAIDVVLLDLVMPGLSGEQTLAALRGLRADTRVLLISGYTEGELLRRFGPERGRLAFLSKPFSREALADKLRELLG